MKCRTDVPDSQIKRKEVRHKWKPVIAVRIVRFLSGESGQADIKPIFCGVFMPHCLIFNIRQTLQTEAMRKIGIAPDKLKVLYALNCIERD